MKIKHGVTMVLTKDGKEVASACYFTDRWKQRDCEHACQNRLMHDFFQRNLMSDISGVISSDRHRDILRGLIFRGDCAYKLHSIYMATEDGKIFQVDKDWSEES